MSVLRDSVYACIVGVSYLSEVAELIVESSGVNSFQDVLKHLIDQHQLLLSSTTNIFIIIHVHIHDHGT